MASCSRIMWMFCSFFSLNRKPLWYWNLSVSHKIQIQCLFADNSWNREKCKQRCISPVVLQQFIDLAEKKLMTIMNNSPNCSQGTSLHQTTEPFNEVLGLYGKRQKGPAQPSIPQSPHPQVSNLKAGCLLMLEAWVNSWRRCISCSNVIWLGCLSVCLSLKGLSEMQIMFTCLILLWSVGGRQSLTGTALFQAIGLNPF